MSEITDNGSAPEHLFNWFTNGTVAFQRNVRKYQTQVLNNTPLQKSYKVFHFPPPQKR